MKKTIKFTVLLFFIFSQVLTAQNSTLKFDFSAVKDLVELVKSQEVDTVKINHLLNTEPFEKLYIWSINGIEKDKKDFRQIFYHALLDFELNEKYQTKDFTGRLIGRIIENIQYAKENPDELLKTMEFLKNELVVDSIVNKTYAYCPNKEINANYKVYFLVGLAQGVGPEGFMIIDIANIKPTSNIANIEDWISHELFHSYHNYIPTVQIKDTLYSSLNSILDGLQQEGIGEILRYGGDEISDKQYELANAFLMRFNYKLKRAFEANSYASFEELYKTLYDPYTHKVATMMAFTIQKELGKASLIECVGNKKDFLIKYQHAAKKINDFDKVCQFDNSVINSIIGLEWELIEPRIEE